MRSNYLATAGALRRTMAEAASRALPAIWERVSVSVASAGADAGVIGAGTLALQEHARSEDTAAGSAARMTTIDKGA